MRYAALVPLGLIGYGILTSVPWLFNFLGIALFVAVLRECGRYVVPWPKARRLLRLKSVQDEANPAPPRDPEGAETAKYLFTEDRPGHWAVTPNPSWRDDT